MTIDVFELRDRVVEEYREYVKSFITIADERLAAFAREQLERGTLWPDAILQLNPAFAPDCTLGELARDGVILEETAAFFGRNLRLYRHQREALEAAKRGKSYVVSTGTGSGKSLTYLLPIVDEILRDGPEAEGVRAIIVYPMNALINSQLEALKRYQKQAPQVPVRFARYTGQDEQAERENVRQHLPHILLTNYAMLEYILVRPYERTLLEQATEALRFIVLDEMHVYRGRQGADVAMLLRRLRQRAGHRPRMIGTSATLATEGTRAERRAAIARGATTLFGVEVQPEDVIDETLERVSLAPTPRGRVAVRAAVEAPPPAADPEAVRAHPLVAWIEEAFGIAEEDGRLVRRPPETFAGGVRRLAEESGLDEAFCRERLQATLEAGNAALLPSGEPVFAFRLHQFLSSGGNIYATLHRPTERTFSSEGINRDAEGNVYYPLMFCRECGQEFYRVWRTTKTTGQEHLEPRDPLDSDDQDEQDVAGYLTLDPADFALWSDTDDLFDNVPDSWVEIRKNGPRVKKTYVRLLHARAVFAYLDPAIRHVVEEVIGIGPEGEIGGIERQIARDILLVLVVAVERVARLEVLLARGFGGTPDAVELLPALAAEHERVVDVSLGITIDPFGREGAFRWPVQRCVDIATRAEKLMQPEGEHRLARGQECRVAGLQRCLEPLAAERFVETALLGEAAHASGERLGWAAHQPSILLGDPKRLLDPCHQRMRAHCLGVGSWWWRFHGGAHGDTAAWRRCQAHPLQRLVDHVLRLYLDAEQGGGAARDGGAALRARTLGCQRGAGADHPRPMARALP